MGGYIDHTDAGWWHSLRALGQDTEANLAGGARLLSAAFEPTKKKPARRGRTPKANTSA